MNDQILLIRAENIALRYQLSKCAANPPTGETVVRLVAENSALRVLLGDVYVGMLNAGWHEDELVRRVKAASKPPCN